MEQTEQKHSKKQTSCRDQRDKSRKTTKRPGRKISFLRKLHNKSSLQQEYKKGRKAALAWKKEVISSSSTSVVVSSFRIKARAPKAVKVCFWSLESIIFGISL
jgi:hypothetical protein